MALQLIGTVKCKDTQKAQRWLKDRGVEFHFLDITKKALSAGELDHIAQGAGGYRNLVDEASPAFQKAGLKYIDYDPREELLEKPGILKTPVLREGRKVLLGFDPDGYKEFTHG